MRIRYVLLFIISLPLFFIVSSANSQTDEWTIPYTAIGRGAIESVAWYPDNERIFVSTANDVWIYGLDLEIVAHLPNVGFARLSPDGRYIAGVDENGIITIWSADSLAFESALSQNKPHFEHRALEWSPDSRYLAHVGTCATYCFEVWNANDAFKSIYDDISAGDRLIWSPSGTYLALHQLDTAIVHVLSFGENIRHLLFNPPSEYGIQDIALWVDETHLGFYARIPSDFYYYLTRIDAVSGEQTERVYSTDFIYPPSKDGLSAVGDYDGISIFSGEETVSRLYPNRIAHTGISKFNWNRGGSRLAFGTWDQERPKEAEVMILDASTDQITNRFGGLRQEIEQIQWSLDDRYVFVSDTHQQIALYDTETEAVIARAGTHTLVGVTASWRPQDEQFVIANTLGGWTLWNSNSWSVLAEPTDRSLPFPITNLEWQPYGQLFYASGSHYPYAGSVGRSGFIYDPDHPNIDPLPEFTISISSDSNAVPPFHWHPEEPTIIRYIPQPRQEAVAIWSISDDQLIREYPLNPDGYAYAGLGRYTVLSLSGRYLVLVCDSFSDCQSFALNLETGTKTRTYYTDQNRQYAWTDADILVSASWYIRRNNRPTEYFYASIGGGIPGETISESNFQHKVMGFRADVRRVFLSPHGTYFAVIDVENGGLAGTSESGHPLFPLYDVANVVWSPDETRLVVQRTDGTILLMEADGTILAELDRPRSFNRAGGEFVWSPKGDRLALVNAGYVLVWEISSE